MSTRLELICHASTAATRRSAFSADEPLDDRAKEKLAGVPRRTPNADKRLTSPALRAIQTAEALQLAATVDPMLRECDYGRWTGRSLGEVQAEEPEAVTEWMRDSGAAPHGGESLLALIERVATWLDAQSTVPGKIVAVTHASVFRAAIVHAIEAGPQSFWRVDAMPLSLARLSANKGRWRLVSLGAMDAETRQR